MIMSLSYDMTPCDLVQRYVRADSSTETWVRPGEHQIIQGCDVIGIFTELHFVCWQDEAAVCINLDQSRRTVVMTVMNT